MVKIINKYFSNEGTWDNIRQAIVVEFLHEEPGTRNKGLASKYIYYVETLRGRNRVYLERPAQLNKGFDFVIKVENTEFRKKGVLKYAPSHNNIVEDLRNKKSG